MHRTLVLENVHGLHARPAALLVKSLSQFGCQVTARCGGEEADARSILGLLGLAVGCHSRISFTAVGQDAPQAIAAIDHVFEGQFDEAYVKPGTPSAQSGRTLEPDAAKQPSRP